MLMMLTLDTYLAPTHAVLAGKCVVKFDHYCLLINAAVGDRNHALFLGYCTLQWFLVMWGWMLAWHAVSPCYNLFHLSAAVRHKI